ncbi:glia maturation factor beta-like [Corticium candelabrum]|uniref:glia maturation factor beta-like n=1 Tax=Corticium candelabrum TaxID=121492 RepID=UPI002E272F5A|nr:glia maturation factor beta-like [Corticium candelabrum]
MAENVKICDIDDEVSAKLKKFRFRKEKTNAAIIMKIKADELKIVLEEEHDDISLEDMAAELPERQPRYCAYSYAYQHSDGRVSYPLCFIFVSPEGCHPQTQMMYAGSKNALVKAGGFTKVFEVRNTEDLTEEWLKEKLGFFR